MRKLDFYFDYSSPFTYLAATQIERLAHETEALLVYQPFFLGGLFKAIGTPMVPIETYPEAKRRYYEKDMLRWADRLGVGFRWPSRFPLNTISALRLTFLAGDATSLLVDRIFEACWVEDRDPADPRVLAAIVDELGLDAHLLDRIRDPETKAALKDATDEAARLGICGAPTFVVDGRLFWGQDRLPFVRAALEGWWPEAERRSREAPP